MISSCDIDHDMAEDFQRFLKDKDQKWLKVTTPSLAYLAPTNSPMLYIEWGTEQYFYKDLNSEDRSSKLVPSLMPSQLIILLTSQEHISM